MKIAIIGGGAAGFFAAINIKEMEPDFAVTIYEAASRPLAKVAVSGGGRCNLTNSFEEIRNLQQAYPRGAKLLKGIFRKFDHSATYDWFEDHGIALTTQSDECVFPRSQDSGEIIGMFTSYAKELDIDVRLSHKVTQIEKVCDSFTIELDSRGNCHSESADIVIVTSGGGAKQASFDMLTKLPVTIIPPVPSLFSFNIPSDSITDLMGCVVENTITGLAGTKFRGSGALLVTHWGMSGPAILKLSSHAARELAEREYRGKFFVNWVGETSEKVVHQHIDDIVAKSPQKLVTSVAPFSLPSRLWLHLLSKISISHERRWAELGSKGINRMVTALTSDEYMMGSRSRYKEEFVTCGGVSLDCVHPLSLESTKCSGLYFAGEVLDIDAITGGFNLQAAWSTAYAVASDIVDNK